MVEEKTIILRWRLRYVADVMSWGVAVTGMVLLTGPRLLLDSILGRSSAGFRGIWIVLALSVAGTIAAMCRRLRPTGLALSDKGFLVQGREEQRAFSWSELVAVAVMDRATTRGIARVLELRFRGEEPIYVADDFTIGRDELVRRIRQYASSAGAMPTFNVERPAGEEARKRRIGLIALGAYMLPLLIVVAALIGFAAHMRHSP